MKNLFNAMKEIFSFSLPLIGMRSISALNGFIAMVMIARLGHAQLAAGALLASVQVAISVTGYSLLFSMSVVVGRLYGEKRYNEIGRSLRQSFLLGFLGSIPMFLFYWNMQHILVWFHQPKYLISLIAPYFKIMAWGTFPWMILASLTQFLAGISKPKISFHFNLLSLLTYLIPSYVLLYGGFGFSALGIVGVAYANVFTGAFISLLIFVYIFYNNDFQKFEIFNLAVEKNWQYLRELFLIGFPILLQTAAELGSFAIMTFMIGWLGEVSLAAYQIIFQLASLMIMISLSISQSTGILISQAIGRKNHTETKIIGIAGITFGLLCALLIAIVYLTFPRQIIQWFLVDGNKPIFMQTLQLATILLGIEAIDVIVDFTRNIAVGALRGFHDSKIPMLNSLLVCWVIAIPLGYILGFTFHYGIIGIRVAFVVAMAIGAIMMTRRLCQKWVLVNNG